MQVQFNRPATLGKNTYGKGQHDVPAEDTRNWYFDALVSDGDAVILRDDEAPAKKPAAKKGK